MLPTTPPPNNKYEDIELEIRIGYLEGGVERKRAGNLLNELTPLLFGYLRKHFPTFDHLQIKDICQDSLSKIWDKMSTEEFDFNYTFIPFLVKIAYNRACDIFKSSHFKCTHDDEFAQLVGIQLKETRIGQDWSSIRVDPLMLKKIRAEFTGFIRSLPPKQRLVAQIYFSAFPDILTSHEIQDEIFLKTKETATVLQINGNLQVIKTKFAQLMTKYKKEMTR